MARLPLQQGAREAQQCGGRWIEMSLWDKVNGNNNERHINTQRLARSPFQKTLSRTALLWCGVFLSRSFRVFFFISVRIFMFGAWLQFMYELWDRRETHTHTQNSTIWEYIHSINNFFLTIPVHFCRSPPLRYSTYSHPPSSFRCIVCVWTRERTRYQQNITNNLISNSHSRCRSSAERVNRRAREFSWLYCVL